MALVNGEMERLEKFAGPLGQVVQVFNIALLVILVALVCFVAFTILAPDQYFSGEGSDLARLSFEFNGTLRYTISPTAVKANVNLRGIYTSIAGAAIVYALILRLVLGNLKTIIHSVVIKQPFDLRNRKRILNISWAVMLSAFVIPAVNVWVTSQVIRTFDLQGFSAVYSPHANLIFVAFLLIVLAGVFAYGCHLQQEVDETI
ncbi:MAG: DUF2975 domain-containing protein [Bacillota bacterium]|jgi:hypothetical protein|nr:DUF2975 domain-containing protein [Bacillota bacterium]HHT90126.1 DUF2975 domain-containing protein [Bacillota bacterium]